MDSNPRKIFPFLQLPYHIRHCIYTLTLDYPDLRPVFARVETDMAKTEEEYTHTELPLCVMPVFRVPALLKTTPGIMLCNRQTAWESLETMRFKTFTLQRPPPSTAPLGRVMDITEFINEETLRDVRRMEFIMNLYSNPRAWLKTIETLLDVWSVENHLKSIRVTLEQPNELPPGQFWDRAFSRSAVRALSMVRNIQSICIL